MAFSLKGDRVAVDAEPIETKTAGGLHIPESAVDLNEPRYGTVVAVGDGHRSEHGVLVPIDLEVGQRVAFHKHLGEKWRLDGQEVLVLSPREVIATVEESE